MVREIARETRVIVGSFMPTDLKNNKFRHPVLTTLATANFLLCPLKIDEERHELNVMMMDPKKRNLENPVPSTFVMS